MSRLRAILSLFIMLNHSAYAMNALDAADMGLIWGAPCTGILLSIALCPLIMPKLWHAHYGKIACLWGAATVVPLGAFYGLDPLLHAIAHTYLLEYIPFIILLGTLYVITSGIQLNLHLPCTPLVNMAVLSIGSVLASFIGTTGAAMLLIRPVLDLNQGRRHQAHVVIFFLFSVCNIGGCLSAIGDPPMMLGYLSGISFFWPAQHLFMPFLSVIVPLMLLFWMLDTFYQNRETRPQKNPGRSRITVRGTAQIGLLLCTIATMLGGSAAATGPSLTLGGVAWPVANMVRESTLIAIAFLSFFLSRRQGLLHESFSWEPLKEIAKIFAALFATTIPVLAMLAQGEQGAFAPLTQKVTAQGAMAYFWATGTLSSFLDNAPTYLIFFHIAGADPVTLMGVQSKILTAISTGAVFMGAMTYIGNAPNFLVRTIAESHGVRMPSFFGYMVWTVFILLPLFSLTAWIFFS